MSSERATLGDCPSCETPIPEHKMLIKYERRGSEAIYAECPSCDEPVTPVDDAA